MHTNRPRSAGLLAITILLLATSTTRSQDLIEFLSGAKIEGRVAKINRDNKQVTFDAVIAGRTLSRVYEYSKIHAVTYQGKRYVLNEKAGSTTSTARAPLTGSTQPQTSSGSQRSRVEVEALIKSLGTTPPDWYDATQLNYPQSLDLAWPKPPPKGWNNQKNVGQFIWDIINPNENRWREGIRFMHHLLAVNKDNAEVSRRAMNELGRMYHDLLEDYGRAAYWWQQAGVDRDLSYGRSGPHLAQCYWRLGNRAMAVGLLDKLSKSNQGNVLNNCVKVWGNMGDLTKAKTLGEPLVPAYQKQGFSAGGVLLHLGDAHRVAGRYSQAVVYYQQVLDESNKLKGRVDRNQDRAKANIEAVKLFELSDVAKVPDGTYSDSSLGYEGPVAVEVVVRNRQIASVRVTQHKEKQFYSALTDTPAKIIDKQGVKGVDATSSATITSEAIINATAKALAGAAKTP